MSDTETTAVPEITLRQLTQDERDVIAATVLDSGGSLRQVDVGRRVGLNAQRMNQIVTSLRDRRANGEGPSVLQIAMKRSQLSPRLSAQLSQATPGPESAYESDPGIATWLAGDSAHPADPGDHVQPVNEDEALADARAAMTGHPIESDEAQTPDDGDDQAAAPNVTAQMRQLAETGDGRVLADIMGGVLAEPEPSPEVDPEAEARERVPDVDPEAEAKARERAADEACAAYLNYAERPRVNRSESQVRASIAGALQRSATLTGVARLSAIQARIELEHQLRAHTEWPSDLVAELERGWATHAAEWAGRRGISVQALEEFGVTKGALKRAKLLG